MGDRLGSPGAAVTGSDTDALQRQQHSADPGYPPPPGKKEKKVKQLKQDPGPRPLVVVEPRRSSQVECLQRVQKAPVWKTR